MTPSVFPIEFSGHVAAFDALSTQDQIDVAAAANPIQRLADLHAKHAAALAAPIPPPPPFVPPVAMGRPPPPPDDRPEIRIGVRIDRMVNIATRALRDDADTFQRGGQLVHVARIDADDARPDFPAGTPVIREMGIATLRARLSGQVAWFKFSKREQEWDEARPDEPTVSAVHAAGEWKGLRVLVGISDAPVFRRDGTIQQSPGYDRATGYLYTPSAFFPAVQPRPNRADAQRALAELTEPFADFPFAKPVDRFVLIATILTVLARPAIDGACPMVAVDASTAGSGKTLAADAISTISTGRSASLTNYRADEEDELRKVLDGHALAGSRLVVLDNVASALGGAALDSYITARDTVDVRILGRTGQLQTPWKAMLLATGNNIEPKGDTIRRVLAARIEPTEDRPQDRQQFAHKNLIAYVLRERPRLVVAALTLLRAQAIARSPAPGTWGGFEAWAAIVPPAITFAGGPNVLDARIANTENIDRDAAALTTIMRSLPRLDPSGGGISVRALLNALYPDGRPPPDSAPPDGFAELREAIEHLAPARPGAAPSSSALGYKLRSARGRWLDGVRFVSVSGHAGVTKWRIESAKSESPNPISGGDGGNGGHSTTRAPSFGSSTVDGLPFWGDRAPESPPSYPSPPTLPPPPPGSPSRSADISEADYEERERAALADLKSAAAADAAEGAKPCAPKRQIDLFAREPMPQRRADAYEAMSAFNARIAAAMRGARLKGDQEAAAARCARCGAALPAPAPHPDTMPVCSQCEREIETEIENENESEE